MVKRKAFFCMGFSIHNTEKNYAKALLRAVGWRSWGPDTVETIWLCFECVILWGGWEGFDYETL